MRILIVSQHFWPENFRINDLAVGLKEKGHDVTVLTAKPNYPQGRFFKGYGFFSVASENYEGIHIVRVPVIPRFSGKGWQLVLNYLSFVFFACLLAPFRCKGKFDIVFSYLTSPVTAALPAILLKKIKNAPLFLWVQDLWPESVEATGAIRSSKLLSWIAKLVGFIYRRADKILVSSRSFEKSIKPYIKDINIPIEYFPNSVEAVYQPVEKNMEFKKKYNLPSGFTVMFAGNIGYAQDFPTVLKAAELLRSQSHIHFVIIGDGRHYEWLKNEVQAKNLMNTVHLFGRHPLELMPHFFAHADVLFASLKNEPVFALTVPCKIQSYLACAKPIITAIEGEGGEMIKEAKAGVAVEAGSPEAIAQAVSQLSLVGNNALIEMSNSAHEYYIKYFQRGNLLDNLNEWLVNFCQKNKKKYRPS